MAATPKQPGYIKTENMLIIAFLTLTVGFVGGVFFGVYKSASSVLPQGSGQQAPGNHNTAELAAEIEALEKLTRESPDDTASWIKLGHLYFDTNQVNEAINAYETALKLQPDNPDVITDLGVMYRRAGTPQKAIAKFDQAVAINPSHQIARFNKGVVLMHDLNDPEGAVAAWRELVQLDPNAKAPSGQLVKELISQLENANAQ